MARRAEREEIDDGDSDLATGRDYRSAIFLLEELTRTDRIKEVRE